MTIERVFLGWDGPVLKRAADWLINQAVGQYQSDDGPSDCDLSQHVLVLSASRATRRLLEILVEQCDESGLALTPPQLMTLGGLPDYLIDLNDNGQDENADLKRASDWESRLALAEVLAGLDPALQSDLAPKLPDSPALMDWLTLGDSILKLWQALAAQGLTVEQALDQASPLLPDLTTNRWRAAAIALDQYFQNLLGRKLVDRDQWRIHHARAGEPLVAKEQQRIVLIGCVDLPAITQKMIDLTEATVTALIAAPQALEQGFGRFGQIMADDWLEQELTIDEANIHYVNQATDQFATTVSILQQQPNETLKADSVTIGLGDESLATLAANHLKAFGLPVRTAMGSPVAQQGPAAFLESFARFLDDGRMDSFSILLRQVDLADWLTDHLKDEDATSAIIDDWLNFVDMYRADHLIMHAKPPYPGEPANQVKLKKLFDTVMHIVPEQAQPIDRAMPLQDRLEQVRQMLVTVFGHQSYKRHLPDDLHLLRTLEAVAGAIRELLRIEVPGMVVSLTEAIRLVLLALSGAEIPDERPGEAVELVGWLELLTDDAPLLLMTDVVEGRIPASRNEDLWLPDHLRSILGLPDNETRLARDKYLMQAIHTSREQTHLIVPRHDVDNNPNKPSRLLMACDDATLRQRIIRFYEPDTQETALPELLDAGDRSLFTPPLPKPKQELSKLRVTAFRDYLHCPYRFYLTHILGLEVVEESLPELDGQGFGTLAHAVLEHFGKSKLTNSTSVEEIHEYLSHRLDREVKSHYGSEPPAAAKLQVEQLRYRLQMFARWQAQQVSEGWHILSDFAERSIKATLEVDGKPFIISGKIDRIDRNEQGILRVLDYKTSDTSAKPDKYHLARNEEGELDWIDLQLPLYTHLVQELGLLPDEKTQLGYVSLSKAADANLFVQAKWTWEQTQQAIERARQVIRDIRAGIFWPPTYPAPQFTAHLSGICLDAAPPTPEQLEAKP